MPIPLYPSTAGFRPFAGAGTIPPGYTGALPGAMLNVIDIPDRDGPWGFLTPTVDPLGSTDGKTAFLDNAFGSARFRGWISHNGQTLVVRVRRAAAYAGIGRVRVDGGNWFDVHMDTTNGEYMDLVCSAPLALGDHGFEFEWVQGVTLIDHFILPPA